MTQEEGLEKKLDTHRRQISKLFYDQNELNKKIWEMNFFYPSLQEKISDLELKVNEIYNNQRK